jgi:hypothetical protein
MTILRYSKSPTKIKKIRLVSEERRPILGTNCLARREADVVVLVVFTASRELCDPRRLAGGKGAVET